MKPKKPIHNIMRCEWGSMINGYHESIRKITNKISLRLTITSELRHSFRSAIMEAIRNEA